MSKLDDLINKLCPDGVEWKNLQDVCGVITTGKLNANAMTEDGAYPFFTCDKEVFKIDTYAFDGEAILISGNGSQVGHINYCNRKFNAYQRTYVLMNIKDVSYGFLLHWLHGYLKPYILRNCKKGSVPYITLPMLQEFEFPVPPLEIQNEIVRILDNFTELEEELEEELEARRKQYEYYKSLFFEDNGKYEIKHITDIALVKARVGWQRLTTAEYLDSGEYYLITGTDFQNGIINFDTCHYVTKERYDMDTNIQVHKDDILITKDGTLGKVAMLTEEPKKLATLNSGVFNIHVFDEKIFPRFIYHFFTSKTFTDFVVKVKTGSTIPHLTQQGLVTLNIPIPPFDEQKKIANTLDRFEALCNDITSGLPAEIEARHKQYEYYRDKLLTFKRKSA